MRSMAPRLSGFSSMIFAVRQFSITARRSPFGSASVRKPVDPMIMMSRMTACCSFSRRATRRDRTPLPELKWTMPAARAILDNRRFRQFVRAWFSTSTSTSATVISAEMRKTFSSWIADQEPGLEDREDFLGVHLTITGHTLRERWLAKIGARGGHDVMTSRVDEEHHAHHKRQRNHRSHRAHPSDFSWRASGVKFSLRDGSANPVPIRAARGRSSGTLRVPTVSKRRAERRVAHVSTVHLFRSILRSFPGYKRTDSWREENRHRESEIR